MSIKKKINNPTYIENACEKIADKFLPYIYEEINLMEGKTKMDRKTDLSVNVYSSNRNGYNVFAQIKGLKIDNKLRGRKYNIEGIYAINEIIATISVIVRLLSEIARDGHMGIKVLYRIFLTKNKKEIVDKFNGFQEIEIEEYYWFQKLKELINYYNDSYNMVVFKF